MGSFIIKTLFCISLIIIGFALRVVLWYGSLDDGNCVYHNKQIKTFEEGYIGEVSICFYGTNYSRELVFYRDYQLKNKDPEISFSRNRESEEKFIEELEKIHNKYTNSSRVKLCRYNPENHDHYIKYYTKSFGHPWNYEAWLATLILASYVMILLVIAIIKCD